VSQSPSGVEFPHTSYSFSLSDPSQVGEARRFALVLCDDLNFDETRKGRVGIIVNELGTNLVRYAQDAQLIFRKYANGGGTGVEILSLDKGPGLDIDQSLRDGFSTGGTLGTGLGSIRRQADVFDIYSNSGEGTIILARVHFQNFETPLEGSDTYEMGAISIPIQGEVVCGDSWCVSEFENGCSVIVADGLGHGPLANEAALDAVDVFSNSTRAPVAEKMQLIHERLKRTRGAAVFLADVSGNQVSFAGVGNIRTVIQTDHDLKTLISQNGTAGLQIRSFKALSHEWNGEGHLIFHSDGITSRCSLSAYPGLLNHHPSILAGIIYRDFCRGTDDATVVVLRRRR
jgi:anti-sigma regulatory factor (Ser/Thr protein kinase)